MKEKEKELLFLNKKVPFLIQDFFHQGLFYGITSMKFMELIDVPILEDNKGEQIRNTFINFANLYNDYQYKLKLDLKDFIHSTELKTIQELRDIFYLTLKDVVCAAANANELLFLINKMDFKAEWKCFFDKLMCLFHQIKALLGIKCWSNRIAF